MQSSGEPSNVQENMMPFGRNNAKEYDNNTPPGTSSAGRVQDTNPASKEAGNSKMEESTSGPLDHHQSLRKPDVEPQSQETVASQAGQSGLAVSAHGDKLENGNLQVGRGNQSVSLMGMSKQVNPEMSNWTAFGNHDGVSKEVMAASSGQHGLMPERRDGATSQIQNLKNTGYPGNQLAVNNMSMPSRDHWKPVPGIDNNLHAAVPLKNTSMVSKHVLQGGNLTS